MRMGKQALGGYSRGGRLERESKGAGIGGEGRKREERGGGT